MVKKALPFLMFPPAIGLIWLAVYGLLAAQLPTMWTFGMLLALAMLSLFIGLSAILALTRSRTGLFIARPWLGLGLIYLIPFCAWILPILLTEGEIPFAGPVFERLATGPWPALWQFLILSILLGLHSQRPLQSLKQSIFTTNFVDKLIDVAAGLGLWLCAIFIRSILIHLWPLPSSPIPRPELAAGVLFLVLPLVEEPFFRRDLVLVLRQNNKIAQAVLLSAFIYAFIQTLFLPPRPFPVILAGLPSNFLLAFGLSFLYARTGRISAPILAHISFNLFTMLFP